MESSSLSGELPLAACLGALRESLDSETMPSSIFWLERAYAAFVEQGEE
jgi:hypothetical protein